MSLNYNGDNSYWFVKFKAKDSEIVANPIYLGNAFGDNPSIANAKKLDCMVLFLTLVLITELLQLMKYKMMLRFIKKYFLQK